ncbi:MAG: peptidylprolyl isomerase, partial [Alloprevotella sp.]|nr:peptidylprolyl isomerase [Alloprevotella sp.]
MVNRHILALLCLLCLSLTATAQSARGVVDEIIWVVGDDPILLSEVEEMRLNNEREGIKMDYCRIPEQIAV